MNALKFEFPPIKNQLAGKYFSSGNDFVETVDSLSDSTQDWVLQDVSLSRIVLLPPIDPKFKDISLKAFADTVNGFKELSRGIKPDRWSPVTVRRATDILENLVDNENEMRPHLRLVKDEDIEDEVEITNNIVEFVKSWRPKEREFYGSVRGQLVGMSISHGHRASLKLPNGRIAQIRFDKDFDNDFKEGLLQFVEIEGEIKKDENDVVYWVKAAELKVLEDNPRLKWAQLFGMFPNFTGDQTTEEYLAASRGKK